MKKSLLLLALSQSVYAIRSVVHRKAASLPAGIHGKVMLSVASEKSKTEVPCSIHNVRTDLYWGSTFSSEKESKAVSV